MSDKFNYGGMTVNERLFVAGMLEEFDDAVHQRNRSRLIEILIEMQLGKAGAERSADCVLASPEVYGF